MQFCKYSPFKESFAVSFLSDATTKVWKKAMISLLDRQYNCSEIDQVPYVLQKGSNGKQLCITKTIHYVYTKYTYNVSQFSPPF